jgi:predicted amidophosphoribosyltransferase
VGGRDLLLVDDVRTTGATLHAAATALKRAGARSVEVALLAAVLS